MNKKESLQLKGIAIILLFWHHLFGCGTFLMLEENVWQPCFGKYDAIIGWGAKICIGLFAAISGYGLYKSYILPDKSRLGKRIVKFLITYWTMLFFMAIPYLIYFDKFNSQWLVMNLFALLHNDEMLYLSLSWYVKVYLEILLVLPLVKFLNKKIGIIHIEIVLYIVLPLTVSCFLPEAEAYFCDWKTNIFSSIKLLFTWYPVFHVGVILSKYGLLEKYIGFSARVLKDEKKYKAAIITFITIWLMLQIICYRGQWIFNYYTDVICVAFFIFAFYFCNQCYSLKVMKFIPGLLEFLGKYSFQYWLVSGMFYLNTTEFQWILVLPKYSVLILIWKFIIITPIAIAMYKISEWIYNNIFKLRRFKLIDDTLSEK